MKTTPILLSLAVLAASPVLAQSKTGAKPAPKPVAAATHTPSAPRAATSGTAKPVVKATPAGKAPAKPAPAAAKPAPAPAAAPSPATTASTPVNKPSSPAASGALFQKGTTMVNLGVGLGLGYGYGFGSGLKATPAVSLSLEKGIIEGIGPGVIGIGGLIGYKGYHYDYPGTDYKARWNNIIVLVRGTYHYDLLQNSKLDTYAGVSLGARIESYKDTYYSEYLGGRYDNSYGGARVEGGIFIGGRYFLTDNIGAFAEAGYDMSYLKLGVTARF
ncbi:hypothetical protein [Hymenobacter metallilatus]|uniref:Outer membrane protein beta-barrel domain-containing protein n=1 Tax=Hymenobacter metallilatus TaxID=2493666 RepID=A0A428JT34_9BACT|nr:hypothetical protein [Hymenobacter metallilatus]RSK37171.1 hypothetical protein EI290_00445 [Hymenobacter metallilatus]